ncbi:Glutamate-1-semialdehyde 2,1-aminomutase [Planctomycetes bacterium Poly30]|uniref:Glutamate-1-semialdehyde 2,1-aminomutase n=1 Tax=Saltatorellus ferox TaxID=2528018 RepID=A0A518F0W9_9BACT|nr:Glutamate-1-semialdehyde 2,1-aminomutase [Planctomycetes bacterium Poly30]
MTPPPFTLSKSEAIFAEAQRLIPGGVNSPVRAYKAVGGVPPHLVRGEGPLVWDEDGNEYVDLVGSYGPLILGHGNAEVREALHAAVDSGTTFGAPTRGELEMARTITERVPGCEMVRLVNSGTEATMSAARLARAATGRPKILKFEGCYHGHGDSFLVSAGSGALTLGAPDSPGVTKATAANSLVAVYNDLDSVKAVFDEHGSDIAAVFVEPVAGNMGTIPPEAGFLEGLRAHCDVSGALLVYDEVMTGFRVAKGGFQDLSDVRCDLITLGKVIGGGLPVGAYGGRSDLMMQVAPAGPMYQAGTLSGNPLAVAAGRKTLEILGRHGIYEQLEYAGSTLQKGLMRVAHEHGRAISVGRVGSMICPYFSAAVPRNLTEVTATDREAWVRFFNVMLRSGILLPPSPYEAIFLSVTHTQPVLDRILEAADLAFREIRSTAE